MALSAAEAALAGTRSRVVAKPGWIGSQPWCSTSLPAASLRPVNRHVDILNMNGESYRLKRSRETAASQDPEDREEE